MTEWRDPSGEAPEPPNPLIGDIWLKGSAEPVWWNGEAWVRFE